MNSGLSYDVVAAAEALGPQVRAARDEIEAARCLPDALVREMAQAGLFQLNLPTSMGGPECDPLTSFRVTETLAQSDGAVAWCASISSAISLFASRVSTAVGQKCFGQPPDARLAGSLRPLGDARGVADGFRVSGRWNFASGITHANWMYCSCVVSDANGPLMTDAGLPVTRACLVPVESVTIVDTWSVVGLRGTGSHDFVVDDVFVPQELSISLADPVLEPGPLYHPRLLLIAANAATAGTALGLARGALSTFRDLAVNTSSTMSETLLRDRGFVQTRMAEAEAIVGSARAYLMHAVGQAWGAIVSEVADPSHEIAQARLSLTHAMGEAIRAVDLVFHAAGTHAVYEKNPLERYFRDVHVAKQHAAGRPEDIEAAGKVFFGLHPDGPGW